MALPIDKEAKCISLHWYLVIGWILCIASVAVLIYSSTEVAQFQALDAKDQVGTALVEQIGWIAGLSASCAVAAASVGSMGWAFYKWDKKSRNENGKVMHEENQETMYTLAKLTALVFSVPIFVVCLLAFYNVGGMSVECDSPAPTVLGFAMGFSAIGIFFCGIDAITDLFNGKNFRFVEGPVKKRKMTPKTHAQMTGICRDMGDIADVLVLLGEKEPHSEPTPDPSEIEPSAAFMRQFANTRARGGQTTFKRDGGASSFNVLDDEELSFSDEETAPERSIPPPAKGFQGKYDKTEHVISTEFKISQIRESEEVSYSRKNSDSRNSLGWNILNLKSALKGSGLPQNAITDDDFNMSESIERGVPAQS